MVVVAALISYADIVKVNRVIINYTPGGATSVIIRILKVNCYTSDRAISIAI